jgi:hypothetical protein
MLATTSSDDSKADARARFHEFRASTNAVDQNLKDKIIRGDEPACDAIFLSFGQKEGSNAFQLLVSPTQKEMSIVIDTRSIEEKAEDTRDISTLPIYDADEVIDKYDHKCQYVRVCFNIKPLECLGVINTVTPRPPLRPGMFITARINPRAWRDEKSKKMNVMIRLTAVEKFSPMPMERVLPLMFQLGAGTRPIRSRIMEYRRVAYELSQTLGDGDDFEKAKNMLGFRIKNDFIVMMGFYVDKYMDQILDTCDTGMCLTGTVVDEAGKFSFYKKTAKTNLNKYSIEYQGQNWFMTKEREARGEHGFPTDPKDVTKFILRVTLWNEFAEALCIKSVKNWHRLALVNGPYIQAMLVLSEDYEKSLRHGITNYRACTMDETGGDINKTDDPSQIAFDMDTRTKAIFMDPVAVVRRVGLPVSAETVKAFWFGESVPPSITDVGASQANLSDRLTCASECKDMDFADFLASPDHEIRVMVNVTGIPTRSEKWSQPLFGELSVKEGDEVFRFLAKVANNSEQTLARYVTTEKLTLGPSHLLNRFKFDSMSFAGGSLIAYVYFINKTKVDETLASFVRTFGRLKNTANLTRMLTQNSGDTQPLLLTAVAPESSDNKKRSLHAAQLNSDDEEDEEEKKLSDDESKELMDIDDEALVEDLKPVVKKNTKPAVKKARKGDK